VNASPVDLTTSQHGLPENIIPLLQKSLMQHCLAMAIAYRVTAHQQLVV
jgi:hypothetical protein